MENPWFEIRNYAGSGRLTVAQKSVSLLHLIEVKAPPTAYASTRTVANNPGPSQTCMWRFSATASIGVRISRGYVHFLGAIIICLGMKKNIARRTCRMSSSTQNLGAWSTLRWVDGEGVGYTPTQVSSVEIIGKGKVLLLRSHVSQQSGPAIKVINEEPPAILQSSFLKKETKTQGACVHL